MVIFRKRHLAPNLAKLATSKQYENQIADRITYILLYK